LSHILESESLELQECLHCTFSHCAFSYVDAQYIQCLRILENNLLFSVEEQQAVLVVTNHLSS